MKSFIIGLFYENKEPSLTRLIVFTSYLSFLLASAYLLILNQQWIHYETFATLTAGGGIGGQIANKLINFTKGSSEGQPFIKNN